ncbi:unnamed protein product [Urochloa decumbens]|uniref:BTB domain-containing protein n=1 Tax=Urochloa decumbens TaxID=240449 RepID=A0ABC8WB67_9POAL
MPSRLTSPAGTIAGMNHSCTQLREVATSVLHIKVYGFCITKANINHDMGCIRSRCTLEGHDWEIRFHPALYVGRVNYCPGLDLVFLSESRAGVTAILCGKIIAGHSDPEIKPLMVECSITVFRERRPEEAIPVPAPDLHRHLGELFRREAGADVTFAVSSGESFAAHKGVLAVRSPVFMAKFFGQMREKKDDAQVVEILDMDAAVLKAMLGFIYTDEVPELEEKAEDEMTLAQHLLVAADRYGLDRLKVMCERRLALGLEVGMVASTLALAERHNCPRLKAKCIEFIAGGSLENLEAVLGTEGCKDLVASSPSVLAELLKAAHGKKRSRSSDMMQTSCTRPLQ